MIDPDKKLTIIGQTQDDAAGEAFDKAAQMLGLGYPGGPAISKLAAEVTEQQKSSFPVVLPKPMLHSPDFNFSFSGLKTALLYRLKKDHHWQMHIPLYCEAFETAAVEVLVAKTKAAAAKYGSKSILLAGGVAANSRLRSELKKAAELGGFGFSAPDLAYTTDNAAMIGVAAYQKFLRQEFTKPEEMKPLPNLEI